MVLLLLSRMGRRGEKIKKGTKRVGGGGEGGEQGEMSRMRMSESSLTLEALMSDLVQQLEGHFLVLTDGRKPPSPHPNIHTQALPPFSSLLLYLSISLITTVQQPLILHPHINQCRQQRSERESSRMTSLDFQCFRCCLLHVSQMSYALFIYALSYVFIRQRHSLYAFHYPPSSQPTCWLSGLRLDVDGGNPSSPASQSDTSCIMWCEEILPCYAFLSNYLL